MQSLTKFLSTGYHMKNKIFIIFCLISLSNFTQTMENKEKKPQDTSSLPLHFADKNLMQMQEIKTHHKELNEINVTLNVINPDGSTQQTHYNTQIARPIDAFYGPASSHISAFSGSSTWYLANFNWPSQSNSFLPILDDGRDMRKFIKRIRLSKKLLDLLEAQNKQID
jgi:hypothetical protein